MFLQSLIRARIFGANLTAAEKLRDEIVKKELKELSGKAKNVLNTQKTADIKHNIRMDDPESDARLFILMIRMSCIKLCRQHGWSFVETVPKAAENTSSKFFSRCR